MAAKFQFEDMKDVSSARSLLQQGLRVNPHSKHLWIEVCILHSVCVVWWSLPLLLLGGVWSCTSNL